MVIMEGSLRCWKCRRFVLDANSLASSHGELPSTVQKSAEKATVQKVCNVWHVNLEALPGWIITEIDKGQWTIGKLHCFHCGARLGGFNFVSSATCPCGQKVTVHVCKSRTDYEPPHLIRIGKSTKVKFPQKVEHIYKLPTVENMENGEENSLTHYRQNELLHQVKKMELGRVTDALCLETRSHRRGVLEADSNELHFKAANPQPCSSASQPVRARCTMKAFHRKSHSLDFSSQDSKDAAISFPGVHGLRSRTSSCGITMQQINEIASPRQAPLVEAVNLQLPVNEEPNVFVSENQHNLEVDLSSHLPSFGNGFIAEGQELGPGPSVQRHSNNVSARIRGWSLDTSTEENDMTEQEEEGRDGATGNPRSDSIPCLSLRSPLDERILSKRERNRLKSLKRKQRRRERWHQSKLHEQQQTSSANMTSTDDEDDLKWEKEGYICAVCLDIFFSPYVCYPCHHIFCEPCLRTLAKDNPANTPCPLCRTVITRVFFQTELNNTMKSLFSKEYLARRQSFQKASCAKWPLPGCRRFFRVLGGFGRHSDTITRRQFPHGAYRLDSMDFEDDNRGWRFDMDMVIIYIYSVNWVIGFIIFCFLCYFFFPSF
uniref:E3 ubiquitin-protein ligase RNF180 n=2 Tax=Callorhinchus milii TaxID=7868 RepID=A0A4W3K5E9_CALMI